MLLRRRRRTRAGYDDRADLLRVVPLQRLNCTVLVSTLGLSAFAPATPAQTSCEQQIGKQFGTYVILNASAATTSFPVNIPPPQTDHKQECNVKQWKAAGTRVLSSSSGPAKMNTSYSYYAGPDAVSVSTTVEGSRSSSDCRCTAQGHILLEAGWADTITFHSRSMRKVMPNDLKSGNGATQTDIIHLKVHSRPSTVGVTDCYSNAKPAFVYQAEFWIILSTPGLGNPLGLGGGRPRQDIGYCSVDASVGEIEVLNEYPNLLRMGVAEQVIGSMVTQTAPTAGLSRARREGVSVCIDHPSYPADLTMSSASGSQYWCSASSPH
jgi:hypothetical protein